MMKAGIESIVGKTITGIVVATNARDPRAQLFLVAGDGTYLEIWGGDLHCSASMDRGGMDDVLHQIRIMGASIARAAQSG